MTVGQFVYVIRKRIKVASDKAIFMFVKNTLPPTGAFPVPASWRRVSPLQHQRFPTAALMADIYEDHKDEDGFLYITYSGESTFGHALAC